MRQSSFCYWCGIKVVREQMIPVAKRIARKNNTLIYYNGDELCEDAVGTIDHLVRVADGGINQPVNPVISCSTRAT